MDDSITILCGDRVEVNGYIGTVKYYGEIQDKKGIWIGVDWDDPARGKHNGSIGGKCYFKAINQQSGSFIPPQKANFGVTFCEAFADKYKFLFAESKNEQEDEFITCKNVTKSIQFVGVKKLTDTVKKYKFIDVLDLSNCLIRARGDLFLNEEGYTLLNNVTRLNLCNSLISRASHVLEICAEIDNLEFLDLSFNKIDWKCQGCKKQHLKTIILNWCCIDDISILMTLWEGLETISLIHNLLADISGLSFFSDSLTSLDLSFNFISSWDNINILRFLKKLNFLNLSSNPIRSIVFPQNEIDMFPSLTTLYLKDCPIDDIHSYDQINRLSTLRELFCDSGSLQHSQRPILIAKISHLKILNKIAITACERSAAEIDRAIKNCEDPLSRKTMADNLISLRIINENSGRELVKKFPGRIDIGRLKMLLRKLFKINHKNTICLFSYDQVLMEMIELDGDLSSLDFFSVKNDSIIYIRS